MANKPAPKPEDDTYSDEEIAKRVDATVRAMIAMKPKPHKPRPKTRRTSKDEEKNE
jgi:hypothetical protein